MMARYIDADKAVERLRDICAPYEESREVKDEAIEIIVDFPTADVAEVKHGEWECVNNDENVWMCDGDDGCGTTIQIIEGTPTDNCFDFCPACGAKMSGGNTIVTKSSIDNIPTADVTEVKHGRFISELVKKCDWKGKIKEYYQPHSCSCCHTPLYGTEKYCSNCGAKMDGGSE